MPARTVKEFLDGQRIKYVTVTHSPAYTAHEIAESANLPKKEMAKTVMVRLDGKLAMAVLPASERLILQRLKEAAGVGLAELASERDFQASFPDCEVGAMPPFGNLYGMDVYVADSLAEDAEIAFNAGTHTELIRLRFEDFARLVRPKVMDLSSRA